jgi:acyl-CoA thioesterase
MAASRTAPGRTPHSVHVYYLRAGDARRPVDFHVVRSRDGGVLHSCLLTYLTGTTTLETAIGMRRATPVTTFNALIDHALWFHRPIDLSDWVLSDQVSPSGVHGRGLASATMHNRAGQLVCIATQELYFGRAQAD